MRTKTLNGNRNGHSELHTAKALLGQPFPEPDALGARPTNHDAESNAAAAVTTLARGYAVELARRVKAGRLPFSLPAYLADRFGEIAEQVQALGVPERVGA